MIKVVLFEPEIPFNTGAIGRTCVALDLELILIKPYGFSLDDKSVANFLGFRLVSALAPEIFLDPFFLAP